MTPWPNWRYTAHNKIRAHGPNLLGVVSGLIGALAFAPFSFWPCFALTISGFTWLVLRAQTLRQAATSGFCVGLGIFAAGVSWVYVSMATYGQIGLLLSLLITLLFVALLALFYALSAMMIWRLHRLWPTVSVSLLIGTVFLATEYLRSHLFTGFPWLLPGYAVHNSYLFELAPVGGIWLLSFITVASFSIPTIMVTTGFKTALKRESTTLIALLCIWVGAIILQVNSPQWVTIKDTLTATLVQGNLSQDEKWLVEQAAPSLAYYQQASLDNISSDLIVWPETAITYLYHQVYDYLIPFQDELIETKTTVISGVPYWDSEQASYHNAVWAMGEGFGLYFKQRLVPFGEYIPMQTIVGKILDIFGMPMSMFSPGPENQPVLQVREWGVAAFICYEIVYPELVRQLVRDSDFLLTISNDGWFGASIGPIQHLQIAQFRAKESGRYVIRATNTGVTAIIDHQGVITAAAPQFVRTTLTGTVGIASGVTPYVRHGDFVILTLILGLFILQLLQSVILIRRNHF